MSYSQALQIFDGVMLGDGGLIQMGESAYFRMGLSGKKRKIPAEEFLEYLQYLKSAFETLRVKTGPTFPKVKPRGAKLKTAGKWVPTALLETLTSPFLLNQYYKWYKGGETRRTKCEPHKGGYYYTAAAMKVVPSDLILTPITLAHWFMGDGNSYQFRARPTVAASFASHGFDEHSIEVLEHQLHSLDISTGRGNYSHRIQKGAGIIITVLQNSVNRLMELVEPHIFACYSYKIKYRIS